jgi:hypothetical protein
MGGVRFKTKRARQVFVEHTTAHLHVLERVLDGGDLLLHDVHLVLRAAAAAAARACGCWHCGVVALFSVLVW